MGYTDPAKQARGGHGPRMDGAAPQAQPRRLAADVPGGMAKAGRHDFFKNAERPEPSGPDTEEPGGPGTSWRRRR
jgi:hypothetical protein